MSTRFVFDSVLDSLRDRNGRSSHHTPERPTQADFCACGHASNGGAEGVYNEEAFQYFLEVEQKRSELLNRPFVLLLLDMTRDSLPTLEIDMPSAQKLFSALSICVRETDFIGWYRAHSVAGAVLTQHSDTAGANLEDAIRRRISRVLREGLPSELARQVRVRVYQLPSAAVQSAG